ncbi:MAG: thiamine pyrophosphate-binding protein [Elusimicrobiales bacterium]|nr:thiamine pyrophosphate-binding protein [Elusimicrobiales bacterium]
MKRVSDFIVERLIYHGIRHFFMIPGGGAMFLNDSIGRNKEIKYICNHHEQASAIAAEGYFRASGKICAVVVTTGPGGTNTLTGVLGQWLDSIPCIYISGQIKTVTMIDNYGNYKLRQLGDQEFRIIDVVKNMTKYAVCVKNPLEIKYHIDKAIKIATTPRFGPVWLDIPVDIQSAVVDETKMIEYDEKENEMSFDFKKVENDIEIVFNKLRQSRSPLIVVGHGIRLSNSIEDFFRMLNNFKNIPVVTTFNGFDIVPSDYPNFVGRIGTLGTRCGNFALQNADLILFLGTRNNIRQIGYNWSDFGRNAYKVVVDIDENELKKPTLVPDLPINFNVKHFLNLINEKFKRENFDIGKWEKWLKWCQDKRDKYPVVFKNNIKINEKVDPYYFINELTKETNINDIIVAANGSACVCLFQAGIVKKGQRIFWNSGCASMGYDLPAAIGAAIATGKDVICLAGDGSIMMNLQELAVISYHNLPIKIFILNNDGYISMKQTQDNFFGFRCACDSNTGIGFPNFNKISKSFGIRYFSIKKNKDLNKLRELLKTPPPFICEVFLKEDYKFAPKVSSERLPDGRFLSKPLEDMWPFLPREEFLKNSKFYGEEK